jgi:hypothetical protein
MIFKLQINVFIKHGLYIFSQKLTIEKFPSMLKAVTIASGSSSFKSTTEILKDAELLFIKCLGITSSPHSHLEILRVTWRKIS